MVFSDLFFLFVFIPCFVVCYALGTLVDRRRGGMAYKNAALIAFSLVFYAWGEPVYVFLMLASVMVNYLLGRLIARYDSADEAPRRRRALIAGVAVNVLIIGVFKYADFVVDLFNGLGLSIPYPHIALPIGISFYTFQSISYLVDVYRRDAVVRRRFSELLLYISMFPQLIAGPIVRFNTVADEIKHRSVTLADISEGVFRFLIGLGKKVIIANQLSEIADQFLDGNLDMLGTGGAWMGLVAFTLQIYFDFSGYSDMAIGMGRCMGFHFNENFDHPYCCASITDFWRRWHISLGTFFRDYLYIPMGGNRRHQYLNILVVWFTTGLWHGASWNFVIWGLYFALLLTVEKTLLGRNSVRRPAVSVLNRVLALLAVVVGWGIFYYDDFGRMTDFFGTLFFGGLDIHDFAVGSVIADRFWLLVAALVLCLPVRRWVEARLEPFAQGQWLMTARAAVSVLILVASVLLLVGATNNAFIYTRF